ncbi:hypothetical protein [Urbifossiella limnaea]|uniref:Uncharacterized protein n=1 Tax=Urbifossiella limnaea TaxID=2528023 RepID=A0A517XV86_9BACT|nr:hypothetical protein [Urbifossiella limnaea]QDU21425.1 hypothetical protein ETAA1_33920 [Urbifossiella limnaea]
MTDRLARFTPVGPDPAELLVRMGRASAPTRMRWRVAVAVLLASNVAFAWFALRPAPPTEPVLVPVVVPIAVPNTPVPPWSGGLRVYDDPDRWQPEPLAGVAPSGPMLTPLAARHGDID